MKDWRRIREIFDQAVELKGEARAQYLAESCGGDEEIRLEVEKLLKAGDNAGSFIEKPLFSNADANSAHDPLLEFVGRQIGAYRILEEIGRGGMGAVFLAVRADGEYQKKVAIKILPPDVGKNEVDRFRRERQILADLDHHNIARLIDAGTTDGVPWVVMDYVEGKSLRTIIEEQVTIPLEPVIEITRQICSGLAAAHDMGIIHRDIKPENIIVSERNSSLIVKILDFGIARSGGLASKDNKTNTGIIMGTAAYMSPEQSTGIVGQKIDTRSDIYSLGTVIYEMLTGQKVFEGDSILDILNRQRHVPPVPLRKRCPDLNIPEAIERVVLKSLEKEREERQQNVKELITELEEAFQASVKKVDRKRSRIARAAVPGVLAAAALAAVVTIAWVQRRSTPAASLTAPPAVTSKLAGSANTVKTSSVPAGSGEIEVMKYYLEVINEKRRTRKFTDADLLKPSDGFKFHFTSNKPGFIYLVSTKNNRPTLFLSARKAGRTGEPSNYVKAGEDFIFPQGEKHWIGVKSQIQNFTVILSKDLLESPAFLCTEFEHALTDEEAVEFESLRRKSAVDLREVKIVKGTVKIPVDQSSLGPVVFDIPIRLK